MLNPVGSVIKTAVRRQRALYIGLLLSLGLLLSACGDANRLQPLAADARILAFGDSLTFGTGAARDASYPAVLQQLSGRQVINAGIPGEVSARGLARLPALLDEHRPALLILCHGGNDFLRRLDRAALAANLQSMIETARSRAIQVLLVGIPAPGLWLSTADTYHQVAQASGVLLEDEIFAEVLGDRSLKSDNVHPNAEGYRLVAERIHQTLREQGAL